MSVPTYLSKIEKALAAGNATEHTHRPALKEFLESLKPKITATNEPRREECGAPDYVVSLENRHGLLTIGYVEAKDVGTSLDHVERTEQLQRYRRYLPNLILTDYLEFRWYVDADPRGKASLARAGRGGKLKRDKKGADEVHRLIHAFLEHEPAPIRRPQELAARMARLTHMIRDIIIEAIESGRASGTLTDLRKAFAQALIPDLDLPEKTADFADMYAQTIAYGLFAARCNHRGSRPFRRLGAAREIPKTNPFLRRLFETITGADLDEEPYAGFVDDLADLLAHAEMAAVLEQFGKRTRREDPVVHFYETFLAAYDPKLREGRGVYYTPEPVVSYIVRSVDHLLKTRFGCPEGLADTSTCQFEREAPGGETETETSPRVLILDPACGTGTFLYAVLDHIRERFMASGNAGMWSGYVRNHLLPRLFGFELLMAPYAVAHFKLGMQLAAQDLPSDQLRKKWAYDVAAGAEDRLKVYLTNTLEGIDREIQKLLGPFAIISEEANAARDIKRHLPIMVVMGNPPYSGHSANRSYMERFIEPFMPYTVLTKGRPKQRKAGKKGVTLREDTFIGRMIRDYHEVDGKPLGERNPKWLQDDYVKFIRWGTWRIDRTGAGILAFITNHSYLDNPTFRGMRQQLMQSFTDIYILDLHGSAKKKETCPDGSKDENVFDIQQGVAIGIFLKDPKKDGRAKVRHAHLWGLRRVKHERLMDWQVDSTDWTELNPQSPFYLFVPQDRRLRDEYQEAWKITEVMPVNVLGFQTHRDHFAIDFDRDPVYRRVAEMRGSTTDDHEFAEKYLLRDNRDWHLADARKAVRQNPNWETALLECLYRPFDWRHCYFSTVAMDYPRRQLLDHVAGRDNRCLLVPRQIGVLGWRHIWAASEVAESCVVSTKTKEQNYNFPVYVYPNLEKQGTLFPNGTARHPNLSRNFLTTIEARLRLSFVDDGRGDLNHTVGPEDAVDYIYAVLHSPTYRERYAAFLKMDFPRIPLTSHKALFRRLCELGSELVALHLLESPLLVQSGFITHYPIPGNNLVEKGHPKYLAPGEREPGTGKPLAQGRVYISKDKPRQNRQGQYFEGVPPEVWEFYVGGYQVCEKWLKDRRGRTLSYQDLQHYRKVVLALKETIRLMKEIDAAIPAWPIQ